MRAYLITGVAGFIGSTLAERLVRMGHTIVGVDSLINYHFRRQKIKNLGWLLHQQQFTFLEQDLLNLDLDDLLGNVEGVFHLAGQPEVRASWGEGFSSHVRNNVLATQRLLESAKNHDLKKLIYASSSSVYGNCPMPVREDHPLQPLSPYGITKLAAEQLCRLYWTNFGVPTVSLRYFSVYGPRQRADMVLHRAINSLLCNEPITIYGDGNQRRDFTYVDDAVDATIQAMDKASAGETINIAGGLSLSLNTVLVILQDVCGLKARSNYEEPARGDVQNTQADTQKSYQFLGFKPRTCLKEGLLQQYLWQKKDLL